MYSLLETNIDIEQFLKTIHRYVQLGVHIKGYYSQKYKRFHREVSEVVEFYVTKDTNEAKSQTLYKKTPEGNVIMHNPTEYLIGYLESQGVIMPKDILVKEEFREPTNNQTNIPVANSTQYYSNGPVTSNAIPNNNVNNMNYYNTQQ